MRHSYTPIGTCLTPFTSDETTAVIVILNAFRQSIKQKAPLSDLVVLFTQSRAQSIMVVCIELLRSHFTDTHLFQGEVSRPDKWV